MASTSDTQSTFSSQPTGTTNFFDQTDLPAHLHPHIIRQRQQNNNNQNNTFRLDPTLAPGYTLVIEPLRPLKRKRESWTWEYGVKVKDHEGVDYWLCKACKYKAIRINTSISTKFYRP